MKRFYLAAVLGLGLFAAQASAEPGGATPLPPAPGAAGCADCGGVPAASEARKYGLLPFIRRLAFWKKDDCGDDCGRGKIIGGRAPASAWETPLPPPGIGYPGTPGHAMPGTLVFPNHPYSRSPRDFFLWEPK